MANSQPPPWEEWDRIAAEAMRGHQARADTDGGLRGRLVRASIWFALAILPARERWLGWLLDRPHAIVQDHDGPVLEPAETLASLPSRP